MRENREMTQTKKDRTEMERIILIETSTALCSTALAEDGRIVSYRESGEARSHASLTAVFIKEMLDESGYEARDCDAVCVSMGPLRGSDRAWFIYRPQSRRVDGQRALFRSRDTSSRGRNARNTCKTSH